MPTWWIPLIALVVFWSVPPFIGVAQTVNLVLRARGGRIRPQDASHLNIPPPAILQPVVSDLLGLGFTRVGEGGQKEYEAQAGPAQVFCFADRVGTTCAGIFAVRGQVYGTVYSWFSDQAVIVTGWRQGQKVDDPDFRYHVVMDSITAAYTYHLAQLPDFMMRYGNPVKLTTMSEILRLDAIYNTKFVIRRFLPNLRRHLIGLAIRLYAFFLVGLSVYLLAATDLPQAVVTATALVLFIPAFLLDRRVAPRRAARS